MKAIKVAFIGLTVLLITTAPASGDGVKQDAAEEDSALAPAVKEPVNAEGLWLYHPSEDLVPKVHGDYKFLDSNEEAIWIGAFQGISTETGTLVFHNSGAWLFKTTITFPNATVGGKEGPLTMSVFGSGPEFGPGVVFAGKWVIIKGEGELADVQGEGTWWGPGFFAPVSIPPAEGQPLFDCGFAIDYPSNDPWKPDPERQYGQVCYSGNINWVSDE